MNAGFTDVRVKDDMKDTKRISESAWRHMSKLTGRILSEVRKDKRQVIPL